MSLKVKFWPFLTPPHYTNSQISITSFGYVNIYVGKNLFNFVSPPWKLDNQYCHKQELWQSQSSFAPYTRKKKFVAAKQSVLCQQQRWLCQTFAPLIFILRLNLIAEFSCSSLFFFIQKKTFEKQQQHCTFFSIPSLSLDLRVAQEKREQLFPTVQWM